MARKTPAAPAEDPNPNPAPTPAPTEAPAPTGAPMPAALELTPTPAPAAAPVPGLDDFIAAHEKAAQAVDLVVTAISHPDAKPGHRIGVYSGFPITNGPLQATYNDGSTH